MACKAVSSSLVFYDVPSLSGRHMQPRSGWKRECHVVAATGTPALKACTRAPKRHTGASQRTLLISASASTAAVAAPELELVTKYSEIVPDTVVGDDYGRFKPTAATVSSSLLLGVSGLPEGRFDGAIESALAYGKCYIEEKGDSRMSCFVDKALVNVGAELAQMVGGRVSTEVDARLANDTGALIDKVRTLVKLYNEVEVPQERVLYRLPATWKAIEAARQLEADGIKTHLVNVYSFAQAAACAQAGVSVIQISLARIRDWARTNSGDVSVEAAVEAGKDPGTELVIKAYNFIYKLGHMTKVMASNIRSKQDVFDLLGVDYLVLPVKLLESLNDTPAGPEEQYLASRRIALSPEEASTYSTEEKEDWDEERFNRELGPCAAQLLQTDIEGTISQTHRVEEHFTKIWPPPNV